MGVHLLAFADTAFLDAADAPQAGGGASMLPLLIIGGALIAFMMWSNRRRQKQAAQFRSRLRPGQRVQLYAGLIGNIVTIGEREVFIELAPGVVVTAVPQAVQGIVEDIDEGDDDPAVDPDTDADAGTSDDLDR